MANDSFAIVSEQFSRKRENAERSSEARRLLLHEKIPRVKEIDARLAATGLEIMNSVMYDGDTDKLIGELRVKNERLLEERARLLAENGYTPDFSDLKFECEKCRDSGYIGLYMCDCFRRELNRVNYLSAGLGKALEDMTFENFNINYAVGKSENGVTPRENFRRVVDFCIEYSREVGKKQSNLILMGGTGLGKTHLSSAIAKEAIKNGCAVYYESAVNLIDKFQRGDSDTCDRIMGCGLLICDDFGSEYLNDYRESIIYNILNTRLVNGVSTLLNTNLNKKELEKKYDSRICSRLFGEYKIAYLFGQDVRKLKQLEKSEDRTT